MANLGVPGTWRCLSKWGMATEASRTGSGGTEQPLEELSWSSWPRRLLTTSLVLACAVVASLGAGVVFAVTEWQHGAWWYSFQQLSGSLVVEVGSFGSMLLLGSVMLLVVPLFAWDDPLDRSWRA